MTNKWMALLCLMLAAMPLAAQQKPVIGLTLSGGGAKGLAHIGVLKAIDSAGLRIDRLTGTSMGSIIGGMYAAGYSADSIESIARSIDWDNLLSNSVPMRNYIMEEKSEYGKYAAELPIKNGKPTLPTGLLESQELWIKLEEIFFPVQSLPHFDDLPIPFRCIGTDLATGQPYAFSRPPLHAAIRASMAIPGAFSSVELEGRTFVDGGVVRNFPVKDVIAMGANYTIGVSVSAPLKDVSLLNNAAKILTQVVFLAESRDRNEEAALCNQFYEVPMGPYTTGDFASANEIIDLGIAYGRTLYPRFKELADSLRRLDAGYRFVKNRLPGVHHYEVDSITVYGLAPKERNYFIEQLGMDDTLGSVTAPMLTEAMRNAFAYRNYKAIRYEIFPEPNGAYRLHFDVKKEPMFTLKGGINYNSFIGFMLQGNITGRNWLFPYSRTMLSLAAGDNLRALVEHLQLLNYKSTWSYRGAWYAEHQEIDGYNNLTPVGRYNLRYYSFDNQFLNSGRRKWSAGMGLRYDLAVAKPRTFAGLYVDGQSSFLNMYALFAFNTFNRPQYPRKGLKADFQWNYVIAANPRFDLYENGQLIGNEGSVSFTEDNYFQSKLMLHGVVPISQRWVFEPKLQSGINFGSRNTLFNNFFIGGMNRSFRNQITFAGLREGQLASESAVVLSAALRYEPAKELFLTLTANTLTQDFLKNSTQVSEARHVAGLGLTAAYNMLLGPLEFTVMWNSENQKAYAYINLGFPFR